MKKITILSALFLGIASFGYAQLTVSATSTGVSCAGVCDGTVSLTISGSTGGGPFDVFMTDGLGVNYTDTTALTSITYSSICKANPLTIVITDLGNDDIASTTVVVSGPSAILLGAAPSPSNVAVTCHDSCDGKIRTRFTGDGPLSYLWTNGDHGTFNSGQVIVADSLCADTFSVLITDKWGCTKTFTYAQAAYYIVTQPNYIVSSFSVTNASCFNLCNGAITATPTGGNGGNTYDWNGSPTSDATATITSLCDGQYILTVTDSKHCIGVDTATVTEPTDLVTSATPTMVTCNGGSNGTISIGAAGGTAPYTYAWNPNVSSTNSAAGLSAGTYQIIVTDNNGAGVCPDTLSVTITEPAAINPHAGQVDVNCFGDSTGIAYVAPTGGGGSYTYLWSDSTTINDTLNNLIAGTYDVTITDNVLCTQTASITITENPDIVSNISGTDVSCHGFGDGTASVAPSGGSVAGLYDVTWNTGATTYSIGSLSGGIYTATVTDDLGCTEIDTIVVIDPAAFSINFVSTQITCFGDADGMASVSPSGGTPPFTVTWFNPIPFDFDTVSTGLTAGNYTVNVVDAAGCPVTQNFSITEPSLISPNATNTDETCYGQCLATATAAPTGGSGAYTYSWSTGGTGISITNLCSSSYDLTVTDANGCQGTQTVTVNDPAEILMSFSSNDASCGLCNGDATVSPVGGTGTLVIAWETGASTAAISGLCANYYTVTITDDSACTAIDSVQISNPGVLTANPSSTDVTCSGAADGTASVAPTGGAPGYIYAWSTGDTGPNISGLTPGNYDVTITDTQPCTVVQSFTIGSNTDMILTGIQDSASCANICDGVGGVSIVGGAYPYTFSWAFGGTDSLETPLCIGTYDVTVTDNNGCQANTTVTIDPKIVITFGITIVKTDCNDALCDGNANAVASGGVPSYAFSWSTGIPTQIDPSTGFVDSVCTGMLYVTVTDQTGCTGQDSIFMLADTNVLQVTIDPDSISCNGADDGALTAVASGAPSPYTYLWSTGATTATISNLAPGLYSVTVSDTNNCSVSASFVLTEPSVLDVSLSKTDILCHGNSNGQIDATVTGGTTPYSYLWSNAQLTEDISGLLAGTYTIIVTDLHGCTDIASSTINEPSALSNAFTTSNISCFGLSDGQATANPSGGANSYTYQWDINALFQTTQTATGLSALEYFITITDTNNCTLTDSITMTEPTAMSVIMSNTPISCNGNTNGSVTATPSGGTSPYTYLWGPNTGNTTTQTVSSLGAGTYDVTVTDAHSCTTTNSVLLTEPAVLDVTATAHSVTCFGDVDGSIDAVVSGGTAAYSYLWDVASGSQTTATATGLASGTYSVTVTDANGCTDNTSGTVNSPALLQGSPFSTASNCNASDGTARVLPLIGGLPAYQHKWNTGSTSSILTHIAGGVIYTDTITDQLGCQLVVNVPVSEIGGPTSVSIITTDNTCYQACDGTASAAGVTGGVAPYTYLWNDPSATASSNVSNLCAGSYLLLVTDDSSCSYFSPPVLIVEPDSIVIDIITIDASCSGYSDGQIAANPTGGTPTFQYQWSTGATTSSISGLIAGSYDLTVTDNNGCTGQQSGILIDDASVVTTTLSVIDNDCYGDNIGAITLSPSGGSGFYGYAWDPNTGNQTTITASGLMAGTYTVTITDNNGCNMDTNATVSENTDVSITSVVNHTTCGNSDGDITITPSGGIAPYSILWLHDMSTGTSVSGLSAAVYDVVVTDQLSCSDTFSIVVNNSDGPVVTPFITNVLCNGGTNGSAYITVTGGISPYTYLWNPGGETDTFITNVSAGAYFVQVTDQIGCFSITEVDVSEPLPIDISFTTISPTCNATTDGSILATASQGVAPYNYDWSTSGTGAFVSTLGAASYTVTVTDGNACTQQGSITLTAPTAFSVTETTQNLNCNGATDGLAMIDVSGATAPYSYTWSNSMTTSIISSLSAGQYDYTVTDANGCTVSDSVLITEPAGMTVTSVISNTFCTVCIGSVSTVVSGGSSPYTYQWSPGGSISSSANNLCAGIYDLTVTDHNGCESVKTFTVINTDGPQVTVPDVTLSCYGDANGALNASVVGGTSPYTYVWNDPSAQTTATASGLSSGTYQVIVTDNTGCPGLASADVIDPTQITLAMSVTDPDCNTSCDVQATVTPSGGSSPYDYAWNDSHSQTSATATGLCANTYIVAVTDNNGCYVEQTVTVTDASTLNISIVSNDITCNGDGDGNALVTVSGGSPGYNYSWSNSANTAFISTLAQGAYTVSVTDQAGCERTATATINEPTVLSALLSNTDLSCNGVPTGTSTAVVSGGTSPYQYSWASSGSILSTAMGLPAGYQYVTVTDNHGCTYRDSVLINEPTSLNAVVTTVEPNCNATNGSITATPSGGVPPYTYSWSSIGQIDSIADNIGAGPYTLSVTDNGGCQYTQDIFLSNANGPTVSLTSMDVSCGSVNDGSITLTVSGGLYPYTYAWSNGDNDSLANNLTAGIYNVTITDQVGCVSIASDTIFNSTGLNVDADITNISCNSTNDGTITLSVTGGSMPYGYTWSPGGEVTSGISNLVVGTYYVTVVDAGACSYIDSFMVTQAPPLGLTATISNNQCFGDATGSVDVNATGGVLPYTYLWSNADPDDVLGGVIAGTYTVTITDNAGCEFDSVFTLTEPSQITNTFSYVEATCTQSDGSVTASPAGGSGTNYTYLWSGGAAAGQTTQTATALPAGLYTLTITDSLSCTAQFNAALSNINAPDVALTTTDESCLGMSDGTSTALISGGTSPYDVLWSTGDTTLSIDSLPSGEFNISVTDALGCISIVIDTVNPGSNLNVAVGIIDVSCNGGATGQITLSVTGGVSPYLYSWSPIVEDTAVATGLGLGMYYYTITDQNGCSYLDSASIQNASPIDIMFTIDSIDCVGGTGDITLVVSGGNAPYTYSWSDASTASTLSGVIAGTYSVTVTDVTLCQSDTTIVLEDADSLFVDYNLTLPTCNNNDGAILVNVTGGVPAYNIVWGGQAVGQTGSTANLLYADIYPLTITDSKGCTIEDSVALSNNTGPVVVVDSMKDVSCFGYNDGYIYITATSIDVPLVYEWSTGQTTDDITLIDGGSYALTVTDTIGCKTINIYEVIEPDSFYVVLTGQDPNCHGSCDGFASAQFFGGTNPFSYLWDDPLTQTNDTASGLCAGTYNVLVTDDHMCITLSQITLDQPDTIIAAITAVQNAVCSESNEGSISISVSGGTGTIYTFSWTGPDGFTSVIEDITTLYPGSYSVTIADSNNCQVSLDTVVNANVVVSVDSLMSSDTIMCEGDGPVVLTGYSSGLSLTYAWILNGTTIDTDSTTTVNPSAGTYDYIFEVSYSGCVDADTITLTVETLPVADAGEATPIIDGLCRGVGGNPTGPVGATYQWAPSYQLTGVTDPNPQVCPDETTIYYVTVTSSNGCIAVDSVAVLVFPEIKYIGGFTPNGDGINEGWTIENLEDFPAVVVQIYNRWGQKLWESEPGYPTPWNGTYNGNKLPVGTYYYIINLNRPEFPDPITGPITIVR